MIGISGRESLISSSHRGANIRNAEKTDAAKAQTSLDATNAGHTIKINYTYLFGAVDCRFVLVFYVSSKFKKTESPD